MTAELATSLSDKGVDVHILAPSPGPNRYRALPVHRLPLTEPSSFESPQKLSELCGRVRQIKQRIAADIVHLNGVAAYASVHLLTQKTSPAPTLLTLHGPWTKPGDSLVRALIGSVNAVAACSRHTLDFLVDSIPESQRKAQLLRNALPLPEAGSSPPDECPTVLVLGRLSPEKGFDLAIEAAADLRKRFPSLKLLVAGDGPGRGNLRLLADRLELGPSVEFLGPIDRQSVPHLIDRAWVVLVPSLREGFGLSALEAAQRARPVVASSVGGLKEVVIHEQTGLLVSPQDSGELSRALERLLAAPQERLEMGTRAQSHAQRSFSWESYVEGHLALYERLLS